MPRDQEIIHLIKESKAGLFEKFKQIEIQDITHKKNVFNA